MEKKKKNWNSTTSQPKYIYGYHKHIYIKQFDNEQMP